MFSKLKIGVLLQNVEDNTYAPGVQPSLEFVITSEDICEVCATATLLVCNNEIGVLLAQRVVYSV